GRGGAGHGGEGPRRVRGGGQAAGALRDRVEGPAQGRAQGPAPASADDADPVGAASGLSVRLWTRGETLVSCTSRPRRGRAGVDGTPKRLDRDKERCRC